ncbi:MAG: hypothetical protein HOO67_03380 [Candidatus Peribacteraceae bacterium]|nr:hypothetical protein [Candidatus Peribacteraceae bacterium]
MDQVMTGAAELDALIPELWAAAFYPTLMESLPFNSSVRSDYEGVIAALGDTVKISTIPQFDVATELAEDEKNDADSVTVASTSLIINKQIVKDYIMTNKAQTQSLDAMSALRDLALHALLKKMQQVIIAEVVPNAATPDHSIAYTSATTLALADIIAIKRLLDAANVPDDGSRTMISGTSQWNDLFNITGFVSRDYVPAANAMSSGAIATPVLGFQPKYTTEVGNVSYFFHPMFLQMAVQQSPTVELFNLGGEGKRAKRVNVTALFGVKQMDGLRVATLS